MQAGGHPVISPGSKDHGASGGGGRPDADLHRGAERCWSEHPPCAHVPPPILPELGSTIQRFRSRPFRTRRVTTADRTLHGSADARERAMRAGRVDAPAAVVARTSPAYLERTALEA